jgi:glutathione peroxidase-family protein
MNIWDKHDQVYFATVATSLNLLYPESERIKQLYNLVLSVKNEQRKNEFFEKLISEATDIIPEIKEKDVNGNEIALSSLRGKIVLLSFHASWDEVSRRENAYLKSIYPKYKPKGFEIYQVALEQSKVLWENELLQQEIPWISVSDLLYTDSYPAKVYNINKLPANFLISRDGKIIGKNLFGSMLDDKLQQFLR